MKKLFLLLSCAVIFACNKNNGTPQTTVDNTPPPASATVVATAAIMQGTVPGDVANGIATLYNNSGKYLVRLTNFKTANGPDLKLYLATDKSSSSFISLGKLKAIEGDQNYDVTGVPDIAKYKYVIVWCAQFSIYFGGGEWK
jgi:Electron transfer DM13